MEKHSLSETVVVVVVVVVVAAAATSTTITCSRFPCKLLSP
jgi:hypothetical protein